MEIILSGKGVCLVNDTPYDLGTYRLFFLTPTDFHEVIPDGEITLVNISFDEEMIDSASESTPRLFTCKRAYTLEDEEHARFLSASSLLLHESECTAGENKRRLLGYVLSCMLRKNPVSKEEPPVKSAHLGSVLRAYAYLQTHFKEKITLEELSAEAGYHPSYFSEIFKNTVGETYAETLACLRVANARSLLSSGASVSEACFSSGFGSLSNFFAIFKKKCGASPSEYKKMQKKERAESNA